MFKTQASHTLGFLCDPGHPVFKHFLTDFHPDWQWWDIINNASSAFILDSFPPELKPIIQPIDDPQTNRRLGLLFEAKVGKGKLLVCGMDLNSRISTSPAARQLLHSIYLYMSSPKFKPAMEMDEVYKRR